MNVGSLQLQWSEWKGEVECVGKQGILSYKYSHAINSKSNRDVGGQRCGAKTEEESSSEGFGASPLAYDFSSCLIKEFSTRIQFKLRIGEWLYPSLSSATGCP